MSGMLPPLYSLSHCGNVICHIVGIAMVLQKLKDLLCMHAYGQFYDRGVRPQQIVRMYWPYNHAAS